MVTTLEELVVYLTGDASGFQKMLAQATEQVKGFAATATQALAAVAEFAGFRSSVNAFTDFQDNLVRMEAGLKTNGLAVDETMNKYREFAKQIEATTRVSEMDALKLLGIASTYDLVGEKAQKAANIAIGIGQMRGMAPEAVMQSLSMFMSAMENKGGKGGTGGGRGVYRLAYMLGIAPEGRGAGGEGQEKLIEKINKRLKTAEEITQRLGQNFGGQLSRIKNYLQDIGVELGGIVAKWLKPFVDQLQKAVKWFKELNPAIKEIVTVFFALATILTASGPIMRFFMLLVHAAASISPLTVALTAAAVATAGWVHSVGRLGEAWEIVRTKFLEFARIGLDWLENFISSNKRTVLAIGLVATAIVTATVAWKILRGIIAVINSVLSALYIKQIAQVAILAIWRASLLAGRVALAVFGAVLGGAAFLGKLLLTTAVLTAQIALWAVWGAVVVGNAIRVGIVATYLFIVNNGMKLLKYSMDLVKFGLMALATVFDIVWKSLVAGFSAVRVVITVLGTVFYGLSAFVFGVIGAVQAMVTAWHAFTRAMSVTVEAVSSFWTALKDLGSIWGFVVKLAKAFSTWLGTISLAGYTLATIAATAAQSAFTFGLNLLIGYFVVIAPLIWAVNAAIGSLTAVFVAANSIMIGVISWIGVVVGLLTTAFVTAWTTGKKVVKGFLDTLLSIPGHSGPLAHVGNLFREWFDILMDVYHAVTLLPSAINKAGAAALGLKKDMSGMDLAWELLLAGFNLAKEQILATWPPLWDFVQTVASGAWKVIEAGWKAFTAGIKPPFMLAWTALTVNMRFTFLKALQQMLLDLGRAFEGTTGEFLGISKSINQGFTNISKSLDQARKDRDEFAKNPGYQGMAEDQKKAADALATFNEELKKQQKIIADAAKNFNVPENDEVKKARERVLQLRNLIQQATEEQKKEQDKVDLAAPYKAAEKEIKKWEAALYGSAESYSRIQEYIDVLNKGKEEGGKALAGPAAGGEGPAPAPNIVPGGNNAGGGGGGNDVVTWLKAIEKAVRGDVERTRPVTLKGVGLLKL